jgi:aspartate 1-decarboxylase
MTPADAKAYKPKLVYVNNENSQVEADLLDGKLVKVLG